MSNEKTLTEDFLNELEATDLIKKLNCYFIFKVALLKIKVLHNKVRM